MKIIAMNECYHP